MKGKLKCSAIRCANNVNETCIASNIHVMGSEAHTSTETGCDTFIEKGDIFSTSHFTNRNLAGEYVELFSNEPVYMSPDIVCDAEKCIYNVNSVCTADQVKVDGDKAMSSDQTECETFKEYNQ